MLTLYLGDRKSETYALQWKSVQAEQLLKLKIKQTSNQYISF